MVYVCITPVVFFCCVLPAFRINSLPFYFCFDGSNCCYWTKTRSFYPFLKEITHREDITLNLMFSLIFNLNRLGLGLGFRINKRFYKYSSHWVTVVHLRFIFISKIRQKFTPRSVFKKIFISKLCKLINHMSIDFLYHFPFYG